MYIRKLSLLACLLPVLLAAQQPPTTMTKMVVQLESADAPAGSFAARPRTLYRAGTQFCRIEEAPDPDRGIHGLVIINEPDFWMVNLADGTTKHAVDPGPTFNCRMPIFTSIPPASDEVKKQISALEFGHEIEFFKSKGASPQPGPFLQTKQTSAYKITIGDVSLGLFTYGNPEVPLGVAWSEGDAHAILWYSGYGQLDFDPKLFAKPDAKIVDPK